VVHGFLNIDKPAGLTSHDVVARVRRIARQTRVGHAGTLDPAATGVLVVGLGLATRLIEYVHQAAPKRYRAVVQLGVTTTTDDAEGEVVATAPVPPIDPTDLKRALERFQGPILQVPPMYAALHHNGQRLYELARAGVVVERPARPVTIDRLELLDWAPPLATIDVQCSAGTYIRALARDLGVALGCGAHLRSLRRTAVGSFVIDEAVPLAGLESDAAALATHLLPPERAIAEWPAITLRADEAQRVQHGQALQRADIPGARARAHMLDGRLLAVLIHEGDVWRPEKVFDWTA
jgi:tRNA pseudouridine55 synthase